MTSSGKPISARAGINTLITCNLRSHAMTLFSIPIGPHDIPFAAPLMTAALLAFSIGFIIPKLMDRFIESEAHSSPSNKPGDAE